MSEPPLRFNLIELESEGTIPVYVNDRFAWQLPKKLLSMRAPKVLEGDATSWKIQNFSPDAFKLLTGWLYSPRGILSGPPAGKPINPYLELARLANRYEIAGLAPLVNKMVQKSFDDPENMAFMGETYNALDPHSPDRASISARFAALVVSKNMDVSTLKPLLKSSDLTRDMLAWIAIYYEHRCEHKELDEIMIWMAGQCQLWLDAVDEAAN
ncbi:hypothetical protein TSTA_012840 [Talaromyces stipitatus ATCC 10500]|uniref:BTB domain-containing protein n=1 Tax=Talaromyces stipitatus (strain ATCC 10500 / CBS 375.48 / QM 6759 / NRRL 1006) TaxID=441959 RepID=B8MF78_TALSN|nr:uncharacterized protein TSTA_012840 [Talaromyces stipitatus ATCC 10500]EED16177.1 hypothetical protein TSTA_012840 [Talaromyces stipitatus ATCC 10500]